MSMSYQIQLKKQTIVILLTRLLFYSKIIKKNITLTFSKAYPFIWKNFSNLLGYATMFGEDFPDVG